MFAVGLLMLIVVLLVAECHAETKQEVRLGRSPSLQRTSTALATQQSVPGPRTLLAAIFPLVSFLSSFHGPKGTLVLFSLVLLFFAHLLSTRLRPATFNYVIRIIVKFILTKQIIVNGFLELYRKFQSQLYSKIFMNENSADCLI